MGDPGVADLDREIAWCRSPDLLTDVLERIISGHTKVNALKELLPWEWNAPRDAAVA